MAEIKIIGITQQVQLPDYSSLAIPAKVDTGADDSAIWASDIVEDDGVLTFCLFAPQSIFYTGEVLSTDAYRVARVKNSFGEYEYRYKVKLRMKLGTTIYKVSFNLADRSHNRYPVLLGKKFLNRRFVVDVSKYNDNEALGLKKGERPVVVLTSMTSPKTREFFDIVKDNLDSDLILEHYDDLRLQISKNGEPNIYLKDGSDIAQARLVYFKTYHRYPEFASAIASYLRYKHVPFLDEEVGKSVSYSKLSELFQLSTCGLPIPQTFVVASAGKLPTYDSLVKSFGTTFVLKDAYSDRGKNNFLISDSDSYAQARKKLMNADASILLVQRYIPNNGFLRVLVMDDKIVQIIKRSKSQQADPLKVHLNKPNGGENAVEVDESKYDSQVISLAQKAALNMARNIAGVDLIQDKKSGKWYILEVNYNPEVVGVRHRQKRAEALAQLLESSKYKGV